MTEEKKSLTYSERAIRKSKIEFYADCPINIIYGAVTPCCSWDFSVKIDSAILTQEEIGKKLMELSKMTGKKYKWSTIHPEYSEESKEGEFNGLAAIGRFVDGIDISADQGCHKLVRGSKLIKILGESERIVEDLKNIGFREINKNDLYLHVEYYRD